MKNNLISSLTVILCMLSCQQKDPNAIIPFVVTEPVPHDTDDPAIWINPKDPNKSIVLGTDKDENGGLYAYDLSGRMINKIEGLQRPNNVDVEYGMMLAGSSYDIAAVTERNTNDVLIYSLPSLNLLSRIPVFEGEKEQSPMGIALYKNPITKEVYFIVGRKHGPTEGYLWQYRLKDNNGQLIGEFERTLGNFSGQKEIEAIAVDDALGYVYYSDEGYGIRQYYADPEKGNEEISVFGKKDFKEDMEGICIYAKPSGEGYILISDQQANRFNVYRRANPSKGLLASLTLSSKECDGAEVSSASFHPKFPNGFLVTMSNEKVFQYYDWQVIEKKLDALK